MIGEEHRQIMPKLYRMIKPNGCILVLYMAWLPYEDQIAKASETLVLKYSPKWSGAGEKIHPIFIPECYHEKFELVYHEEYRINVHFTKESWIGEEIGMYVGGLLFSEHNTVFLM